MKIIFLVFVAVEMGLIGGAAYIRAILIPQSIGKRRNKKITWNKIYLEDMQNYNEYEKKLDKLSKKLAITPFILALFFCLIIVVFKL